MQNNNNLRPNSVKSNSKENYDWHVSRQVHAEAFKTICCFIDNAIIKEKEVHKVNDLNNHYQEILYELGGSKYGDKIKIQKGKRKKGKHHFQ